MLSWLRDAKQFSSPRPVEGVAPRPREKRIVEERPTASAPGSVREDARGVAIRQDRTSPDAEDGDRATAPRAVADSCGARDEPSLCGQTQVRTGFFGDFNLQILGMDT